MFRKIIAMFIITVFMPQFVFAATIPQDLTVTDKLTCVEKLLYGSEQTGALTERAAKLEKEVYGKENKDSLISRVDRIYLHIKENTSLEPSFITKLNAVEWSITHNISIQPIKSRLESLELMLFSKSQTGTYDTRLAQVMITAFSSGRADLVSAKAAKDTLVKIKLVTELSSKNNHANDIVIYEASEDVFVDGQLVIARGAKGLGHVVKVVQSRNFGRDAELQISFDTIEGIDGTVIGVILGDKAKDETKSLATAAGASVAGMVILGPIGIIGGAFIHGKNIEIKPGTELYVQIKADTEVYGVKVK